MLRPEMKSGKNAECQGTEKNCYAWRTMTREHGEPDLLAFINGAHWRWLRRAERMPECPQAYGKLEGRRLKKRSRTGLGR